MPARHKRPVHHHWGLVAIVALVVVAVAVLAVRALDAPRGGVAADTTATTGPATSPAAGPAASPTAGPTAGASSGGGPAPIEVSAGATTVRPMERVPLAGRFDARGTALRVQYLDRPGVWADFPLPTVVDEAGRFRTYVELGGRGLHRLRVVDPASGARSETVTIRVR